MLERRPALGKGLSALIPDAPEPIRPGTMEVDIDLLSPNEQQPRLTMDDAKLHELAQSIKANGIIQPILVRRDGAAYRIIAGERRWRAAQRAGLQRVPVVVRDVSQGDKQLLELALIENLQRENLNPVDEALAYQRLAEDFSLTQDQIAAAVGKDRSSVANFIRLLRLPEEVRGDLAAGTLSTGHARALLPLPDAAAQRQAAREVVSRGLSVREAEALVKRLLAQGTATRSPARSSDSPNDVHTKAAEDRLRFALGSKVRIIRRGQGGRIEVDFSSEAELNRIYEYITSPR
jgi:ParB family chromosome partitioning protein